MSDPWLSIITVNRNNVQGLQRTLKSTTEQTFANFEQIVVDGGSSDGSRELLSDPAYRVSRWVSEPDRGIYHAMNKGIEMSRGRFVLFLNSGDHFIDTNSLQLAQTACTDVDINYFNVQFQLPVDGGWKSVKKLYPETLSFSFFARDALCHQATLLRRDLFERVGRYDESFAIAADWIFTVLAVCRDQCSYQGHPLVLSVFYHDGISAIPENQSRSHRERDAALRRYLPLFADAANVLGSAGREAEELQALRRSKVIQTLQRMRLLWQF